MRKRSKWSLSQKMSTYSALVVTLISIDVVAWGTLTAYAIEGEVRVCHYTDGGRMLIEETVRCPADNSMVLSTSISTLSSTKERESKRYCQYSNGSLLILDMAMECPESND
ncbi:hypothetical protein [Aliivibrio kagoshimensis]|uniref:hypothetical protein n=1 Tax=Aliivibrio kagoshimensis TaxID=2910230 RepID=UPI003D0E4633